MAYVYTFAYPDRTIFYVGKGSGYGTGTIDGSTGRIRSHLYEASGKRSEVSPVASIIRSMWAQGERVVIRIPHRNLSDEEALRLEWKLICHYGFEQLVNRPTARERKLIKIAKDGASVI